MNILLEGIARQRAMDEDSNKHDETDEAEEMLARCMFTLSTQTHFALKAKTASTTDTTFPRNFQEACKNQHWADGIDREYDALVERNTWQLISFEDGMHPLPYMWKFRIKDTPGADGPFNHKARCCMRGDKQIEYQDYDPESLYAPVVRHETFRMLFAKVAPQGLLLEGADVANAYLYGNLNILVIM